MEKGPDTRTSPSIAAMRKLKCDSVVIDMEAIVLDAKGKSNFQRLQAALGEGGHPENIVAYVF